MDPHLGDYMREVMFPHQLSDLLRRASGRFIVGCNPKNAYPEGSITFNMYNREVACGACEWGPMPVEDVKEKDEINPYRPTYLRRGWKRVIRNICSNVEIPRAIRRRVYALAEKLGWRDAFTASNPTHRVSWLEMRAL